MITAIIGRAGSGKSTLTTNLQRGIKTDILIVDDFVKDLYKNEQFLIWMWPNFSNCFKKGNLDKNLLAKYLVNSIKARQLLEDRIMVLLMAFIDSRRSYYTDRGITLYVDGVLPRFAYLFDQVIYVDQAENNRRKNLKKRKVPNKRIQQIEELQKDFPSFL